MMMLKVFREAVGKGLGQWQRWLEDLYQRTISALANEIHLNEILCIEREFTHIYVVAHALQFYASA